jgi:hypothetical protein
MHYFADSKPRPQSMLGLKSQSHDCACATLVTPGRMPISVSFNTLGQGLEAAENLDPFLAAVLPVLLVTETEVTVEGTLTRALVRNLVDASEGWRNWRADRYHALQIRAARIIDPPPPAFARRAAFAWSGSLRSTHTLVRHLANMVEGAAQIARIVHVVGLKGGMQNASADAIAAEVKKCAERLNATAVCITTNASEIGLVQDEIGVLPIVAAALHLTAKDLRLAFHARSWPFSAQLRFPRPGPAFPDLFCSSQMLIRADGGTTSPTQMAREISEYAPFLLDRVNGCSERPRFTDPCRVCAGCVMTSLAFVGAGITHPILPPPTPFDIESLPWSDPIVAAEAAEIASEWSTPGSRLHLALCRRVKLDRRAATRRELQRWFASAAGLGPIWPR